MFLGFMDNLKDWRGNGFMCDAYSCYDWLKKIVGIRLCRIAYLKIYTNTATVQRCCMHTAFTEYLQHTYICVIAKSYEFLVT